MNILRAAGLLLLTLSSAEADDFTLNTKSFINSIDGTGLSVGQSAMACLVRAGTSGAENPKSGDPASKEYRLLSSVTYTATCTNGTVAVTLKDSSLSNGREFVVLPTSGSWDPAPIASASGPTVSVSYGMKGEPNTVANTCMNAVKARNCTWIWHRVTATFSCHNNKPTVSARLEGSDFPSHRLWINDSCNKEIDQGSFDGLWQCKASGNTSQVAGTRSGAACK